MRASGLTNATGIAASPQFQAAAPFFFVAP
jgi:hypothetical protein